MDKKQFDCKIIELGQLKRTTGGFDGAVPLAYYDQKFIPNPIKKECPDCFEMVENPHCIYEVKWRRDDVFWQKKCLNCGMKSKGMTL